MRWELLRFQVGSSYDMINESPGSVFGTLIVQPSIDRLRLRGDLQHSVKGKGVELASTDISVKLDPLLPEELLPPRWPGTALRSEYDRFDAAYRAVLRDWFRRLQ